MELIDFVVGDKLYKSFTREDAEKAGVDLVIFDAALVNHKKAAVMNNRLTAYKTESDRLYMEWQFDKTPESESRWRQKVIEIKTRYPLLTET
ncbi:hypothetical protein HQQ94_05520 [Shewanella sp. VB17]|uniref:hypothetical protein n=1 Tax=Shewanella sp. VB17 TaxID=2739432 RepID=UPI001565FF51|nr:hypothetical protein [Shewanella sp. VB17]NRD72716.1 hypothetical protein [Shewanella sp. VB17]